MQPLLQHLVRRLQLLYRARPRRRDRIRWRAPVSRRQCGRIIGGCGAGRGRIRKALDHFGLLRRLLLETLVELLVVNAPRAVQIEGLEDCVDVEPWVIEAEGGHRLAEFSLGDGVVPISVPLDEQVHHLHRVFTQCCTQRILHRCRLIR